MRKTLEKELAAALKAKLPENTDAHKEQMLESIRQMQALKQRGRTVSYTHLDVYKRQEPCMESGQMQR